MGHQNTSLESNTKGNLIRLKKKQKNNIHTNPAEKAKTQVTSGHKASLTPLIRNWFHKYDLTNDVVSFQVTREDTMSSLDTQSRRVSSSVRLLFMLPPVFAQ